MSTIIAEGSHSLEGTVKPSGSKDSAIKLIVASLLSNEDIILENIPHTSDVEVMFNIIKQIGGNISWIADNKLMINASTINTHVVPYELGSKSRFAALLAGPLVFRFGKAIVPRSLNLPFRPQPINRWINSWENIGMKVDSDKENVRLILQEKISSDINFKISTHTGTANALISSAFITGETIINNAAEETEVDDLIEFLNTIGGNVERLEPRKIKVVGTNVFKSGYFEAQPDNIEAVAYATAALTTKGNITIKGIKQLQLASFVNFLTKIGARYEHGKDELRVWYGGEEYLPTKIESTPAPGFLADWLPYAALILNYARGTSYIHDTIYVDRLDFSQDLNRMGADIEIKLPSELGFKTMISDESYDYEKFGEPRTAVEIKGPRKLRGTRLNMDDPRFDTALIIAALSAEGKSELIGVDEMHIRYERFFDKLVNLGAELKNIE